MVRQSRPAGYVQWFTEDGLSVGSPTSSELSVLEISSNMTDPTLSYNCLGISSVGQILGGSITIQFYEEPSVVIFTVNGSTSISVNINHSVTFYCLVEGDPQAVAVLIGSGIGKVKVNRSSSDVLEITLNDLQCEDSGRYFCIGWNGFEDNDTSSRKYVDVNIICAPKVKNHTEQTKRIQVSPTKDTVFTFEVYGYPEPTGFELRIETGRSTSAVDKNKYSVTYLPLTPPFGSVTLTIYDANTYGTTTYTLIISSEAGSVEMKLEVIKENPQSPQDIDTRSRDIAIGVSVPSVVLVLATVTAVCVYFRRKRTNIERRESGNHDDSSMYRDQDCIATNTMPI